MALIETINTYQEFARSDGFKELVHDVNNKVQQVIYENNFKPGAPNEDISSILMQIPNQVDDVLRAQHAKVEKVEHLTPEQAVTRQGFFSHSVKPKAEEVPKPPTPDEVTKNKP